MSKGLSFLGLLAAYALLFISLYNPVSMKCHCFVFCIFVSYFSSLCIERLYHLVLLCIALFYSVSRGQCTNVVLFCFVYLCISVCYRDCLTRYRRIVLHCIKVLYYSVSRGCLTLYRRIVLHCIKVLYYSVSRGCQCISVAAPPVPPTRTHFNFCTDLFQILDCR